MTIPTITSVTGTVSTGNTLSIIGTSMMDENTTTWDSQFGSNPTAYGFEGNIDGMWHTNDASSCFTQTSVKLNGSKALRCRVAGGGHGDPNVGGVDYFTSRIWYDATASNGSFFWRAYTRWDAVGNVWADGYMKFIFTCCSGTQWYFELPGTGSGAPTGWLVKYNDSQFTVPVHEGPLQSGRWYCLEGEWTNSPRAMKVWQDGTLVLNAVPDTTFGMTYPDLGIINAHSPNNVIDITNYIDLFAFGHTSRIYPATLVEIGNSSNYATATKRVQEMQAISNTSQQIKVNLTGLGAGPYYLFVTNNRNETSAAYALSGGSAVIPESAFTASPSSGQSPLVVNFTDTSTNTPTGWSWNFGANSTPSTSTAQNPSTTYASGGAKTVTLTASNSAGTDATPASTSIPVRYLKPTNFQAN